MFFYLFIFSSVHNFINLSHCLFLHFVSVLTPPPVCTLTTSCPMVSTTTVQPAPTTFIAMGAVWAQPSPSSLRPPPHPPPRVLPVHGHVPPRLCFQTSPTTACWVPPWCRHHESLAGRSVHLLRLWRATCFLSPCAHFVHITCFISGHLFYSSVKKPEKMWKINNK